VFVIRKLKRKLASVFVLFFLFCFAVASAEMLLEALMEKNARSSGGQQFFFLDNLPKNLMNNRVLIQ
jgi:hypothetical protein